MSIKATHCVNRLQCLQTGIARLKRRSDQLERLSKKYWLARRILFFSGSLLALFVWHFAGRKSGLFLAALFVLVFAMVAIYHNRVRESIGRNSLMLHIKSVQVARLNLDWDHLPLADQSPPETNHLFETDLDVTGERSLHRLLDTSVTREGSSRLRSWLLSNTPDQLIIEKRQSLVRELEKLSLFRDKLHLYAAIASRDTSTPYLAQQRVSQSDRWDSRTLVSWIEHAVSKDSLRPTVILLALLSAGNITLFVLASLNLIPHLWPIAFLIYVGAMIAKQGRIATAWGEVQDLEKALRRFGTVFKYLESRVCSGPEVAQLCGPFLDSHKRPAAELSRIERMAAALGLRTNALLWLLVHAFIPWDFFFTYRLEQLKREISQLLPRWLDAWYELEALNSLANFAWLNPRYAFPEIVSNRKLLAAYGIGHPLIRPKDKICNDFELDEQRRIVILTGSNMAGKSTFLKTVGLNLCLAYAGAPVNAERFQSSLFRLFTCIKVSDSVQDGLSYFYAEVKRLKLLLSALEMDTDQAVIFLIDEIFRGTNNRERHIGSHAFIRALANRRNALGMIATHDLELTKLPDEIPGIENFHFREEIGDGRMVFDYLLRRGPCPTTNALTIMRIEGLPVEGGC
jgi:MutS domain V